MTVRPSGFCRQTGVTLVELVMSIVIIGIALLGILSVINLTASRSADPLVQQQAIAIAEAYLEEIVLQSYGGGASGSRADFDDVDDYNGLVDDGVRDRQGNAIAALSQYRVSVTVTPMVLSGSVDAKQIAVSVSGPGVSGLTLVGYRADY
ncbi:MAG: type II secretion system protein [Methylomonas sp.]|nr:type II secretion system protein [Methylomonas sp.]